MSSREGESCARGEAEEVRDRPRGQEARVQVSLSEWSIAGQGGLSLRPLPSGEATLEVRNDGRASHRLALWRGGSVVGDEVRGGILVAETPFVRPGGTATLDVDLEPAGVRSDMPGAGPYRAWHARADRGYGLIQRGEGAIRPIAPSWPSGS